MIKVKIDTNLNSSKYAELYDLLIDKNNFGRRLYNEIDFSFVAEMIKDNYSSTMGRPSKDVIRMFKYLLLKTNFKLSDRGLIERTKTDMLFKFF